MVLWQTVVGASLGRGVLAGLHKAAVPNGGPAPQDELGKVIEEQTLAPPRPGRPADGDNEEPNR